MNTKLTVSSDNRQYGGPFEAIIKPHKKHGYHRDNQNLTNPDQVANYIDIDDYRFYVCQQDYKVSTSNGVLSPPLVQPTTNYELINANGNNNLSHKHIIPKIGIPDNQIVTVNIIPELIYNPVKINDRMIIKGYYNIDLTDVNLLAHTIDFDATPPQLRSSSQIKANKNMMRM